MEINRNQYVDIFNFPLWMATVGSWRPLPREDGTSMYKIENPEDG